jgi:hypothetical protein
VGRPTKLTAEKQRQIVKLLEAGNYREVVCRPCGIGTSTLYTWLERGAIKESGIYRDFRVAVERAEAEAEVEAVAILRSAIVEGDWRATLGFLERKFPTRWRRQQATELTGADGGPIVVEQSGDLSKLSDDELDVLEEMRRRVAGE